MKIRVEVKFSFPGVHHWAQAPEGVRWLSHPHFHYFYVVARRQVGHADRETEIITLQAAMQAYAKTRWPLTEFNGIGMHLDLGEMSCEMIAIEFLKRFGLDECWVYEDNINGGGVSR